MIGIDLLLLGALAVLVSLLLFGFVGCGLDELGTGPSADYPTTIQQTPGLVAYWPLGEPASTPVAVIGNPAPPGDVAFSANHQSNPHDPSNPLNGAYFTLKPAAPDTQRHSNKTPGTLGLGVTPGILDLLPARTCMQVNGGFVRVPFSPALNPQAFTLEAWVVPADEGFDPGAPYYQCIVESTGPQALGPRSGGWGLYIGPQDPSAPPLSQYFWQVWMVDSTNQFRQVATSTVPVVANRSFYVVLTFNPLGNPPNLQLFLYAPGTNQDLSLNGVRFLTATVLGFQPNTSGDFFIGAGSNLFPAAGSPAQRLYPFNGKIQEVALYNVDLSGGAPNDGGLTTVLGPHQAAGGSF
jgi:Concanavalin A-like lectin/glucanases superfamily